MNAVDLAPGTRVRHTVLDILGTFDPDAVDARTGRDHPTLIPVQWDDEDGWPTSPLYLEVLEPSPVPYVPDEPEAASAGVVVLPPSSQAGLAAVRSRIGGPVAGPAPAAYNRV